jgi:hypothetical protein
MKAQKEQAKTRVNYKIRELTFNIMMQSTLMHKMQGKNSHLIKNLMKT